MGSTTKYLVSIGYQVNGLDKAAQGMGGVTRAADKASRSMFSLRSVLAGAIAWRGISFLKGALIDSNVELQRMNIGMATMVSQQLGVPFQKALGPAQELVGYFRQVAKDSPGTSKDFLEMAQGITAATLSAGGSLREMRELATGATIASQAYGIRGDVASRDIMQMLTQNVGMKDQFARLLIASSGKTVEQFNKLKGRARIDETMKMVTGPQIKDAAKMFGQSWEGQLSTLKENFAIVFQKAGLPLMERLTAEAKRWNQWIDANPGRLEAFAKSFGDALVRGFNAIHSFGRWIYDNRGILMDVAKAFLVFKGASIITGGIGTVIEGFKGLSMALQGPTGLVAVLGYAAYRIAKNIDFILENTPEAKKTRNLIGAVAGFDVGGFINTASENYGKGKPAAIVRDSSAAWKKNFERRDAFFRGPGAANLLDEKGKPPPKDTNVKIGTVKINVKGAKDPDRFAMGIMGIFKQLARNPNQPVRALRG